MNKIVTLALSVTAAAAIFSIAVNWSAPHATPLIQVVDKPAVPTQPKVDLPAGDDELLEVGATTSGVKINLDTTSVKMSDVHVASFFLVILVPASDKGPAFGVIEKVRINCVEHTATIDEQTAIDLDENVLEHKVLPENWVNTHKADQPNHPGAVGVIESLVCPSIPKGKIYTL